MSKEVVVPRPGSSISICITTFNRPDGCLRLLKDIERWSGNHRVRVAVYDDCSPADYREVRQFLRAKGWEWFRADRNHGKQLWWKQINLILQRWSTDAAEHFYFIQDDIRLCRDFFDRTIDLWNRIEDPNKVSLYLLRDEHRDTPGVQCWTKFRSRVEGAVERTQWVDCNAFMASRVFVEALGGELEPISPKRWAPDPTLSSGVGRQFSLRLHAAKKGLFRSLSSYVLHMDDASVMNPEARKKNPMRAVRYIDGPAAEASMFREYETVTASLATIPSRRHSLQKVVARLLPQVDKLNIYLNETPKVGDDGYPNLPPFLVHPKITAVWSRDTEFGDQGDAGKFYWASEVKGWHIVCDDDVLYPPDFVETLIAGCERYGRKVAVGFHGAILTEPFHSYYKCRKVHHFVNELKHDVPVHVIASNSLCYHTSTIRVHRDDFKHPNMGDIWFGLLAQQQKVPLICIAHKGSWMVDDTSTRADSIYAHSKSGAKSQKNTADVQTEVVVGNMPWHVRDASGKVIQTLDVGGKSRKNLAARKAAFLTPTTNRPTLLAACLRSLLAQEGVPEGWDIELLVSGSLADEGRVIADLAGARFIPCEAPTPGDKIEAMRRATDAELLMLADDDDIQSPFRAKASIAAHLEGFAWSSTGGMFCVNTQTQETTWWQGPPNLVGTTISVSAEAARVAGGWPRVPQGKDGLFAARMKSALFKDVTAEIGGSTVTMQHTQNIHRSRPFPKKGDTTRRGHFVVKGVGYLADIQPTLPKGTVHLLESFMSGELCSLCDKKVVFQTYRNRVGERCPSCGSLRRHRRQWEMVEDRVAGTVLHVSPEAGLAARLREKADNYIAVDLEGKSGRVGDIRALDFPEGYFDLIYCSHVLEHVVEVDQALREFHRVLKPGGLAMLDVPTFPHDVSKQIAPDHMGHVWEPGRDWTGKYEEAGFTIVKRHPKGATLCQKVT